MSVPACGRRPFLTARRLVRRTGLLFTRRVEDLPLSSIRAVRVAADAPIDQDFGDVIVERLTNGRTIFGLWQGRRGWRRQFVPTSMVPRVGRFTK